MRDTAPRLWPRTNDYVFALGEMVVISGGRNIALHAKVTALDSIEAGRWSTKYMVDNFSSREMLPDLNDPKIAETELKRQKLQADIQEAAARQKELKAALIG